ncbi:hypothetical protein DTL42_23030 [Bremerella cremea]|uniref:OmpH family outer membrane protein n=1 Tax=Bremerella cremea TaxID=1031537 RepID=A0A368KL66_9BACT|nr:hypothetical protein [Bremerella cremea]RCS41434.1 hypothetical protein DTL42_23030 [Bremerella cremea]
MMKSVWTAVFSVGVSSCFVMADEPLRWTPGQAEKVIGLYDELMESSDWQMAELIALGAKEKFGEEVPAIKRMLEKVEQAKADAKKETVTKKTEMPQKKAALVYMKVYSVEDLVVQRNEELSAGLKKIVTELETAIGEEAITKSNSSLAPFNTNLSIVVGATQEIHDQIAAHLKQMRAAKPAEPAVAK